MIYLWETSDEFGDEMVGEYLVEKSPDRFLFRQGKPFDQAGLTPSFKFTSEAEQLAILDMLPNNALIPLVSSRMAKMLMEICPQDIELVPSEVSASGKRLAGFSIVNVLFSMAGIDHENSRYVYIPGTKQIMKFNRLRLKPNALGSHDLSRDIEYRAFIFASEKIKKILESERVKGCTFVPPESLRP
jgi:hypothetical protein